MAAYAAITVKTSVSTRTVEQDVILGKHWLYLTDDGSCVNRNMLERLL